MRVRWRASRIVARGVIEADRVPILTPVTRPVVEHINGECVATNTYTDLDDIANIITMRQP